VRLRKLSIKEFVFTYLLAVFLGVVTQVLFQVHGASKDISTLAGYIMVLFVFLWMELLRKEVSK